MDIAIDRARPADAQRLAEVYNRSFYADFLRYGQCPGYNRTADSMLGSMRRHLVYKIIAEDRIVGAIGVQPRRGGDYFLAALCVIPEYAGRGIGSRAMAFLDGEFPQAKRWSLETPSDKLQNHRFYKRFGYAVTGEHMDGTVRVSVLERRVELSPKSGGLP